MDRLLLYGGSFNPIHHGHLIVARAVAEAVGVARVVLIPAAVPPHKDAHLLAPADDRLAMCRHAVAGDPLFEVDDWETRQPGPNYTITTVRHYRAQVDPGTEICWLIGADSFPELPTWYQIRELVAEARIITACRPGFTAKATPELIECLSEAVVRKLQADALETPQIDISATELRARIRADKSVRYLMPEAAAAFLECAQLYR